MEAVAVEFFSAIHFCALQHPDETLFENDIRTLAANFCDSKQTNKLFTDFSQKIEKRQND
ncbi:MAG: hypothetical protein ACTSUE_05245 [Promethearchaeota archaeon]